MTLRTTTMAGLLAAVAAIHPSHAQLPVSRSTGILPVSLTAPQLKLISLPFTSEPVVRGEVTTQAANTVTIAGATGLNSLSGPFVLHVVTGLNEGESFTISSFPSGNQATSGEALPALTGSQVEIVANHTLDSLFPGGGTFTKGANPGSADNVYLAIGGTLQGFFFDTDVNQWRSTDTTDTANKGGTTISFNAGILVIPAANGSINVAGVARSGDQDVAYPAGLSIVSLPYPTGTTLDASGLAAQINVGANPGNADNVYLAIGGALQGFFFDTDVNQWRSTNTADTANKGSTPISSTDATLLVGNAAGTIEFVQPLDN